MTDHELPNALQERLDRFPPSVIAQYLAHRLDAGVGKRQLVVAVADGRYQAGYVGVPLSEWREWARTIGENARRWRESAKEGEDDYGPVPRHD